MKNFLKQIREAKGLTLEKLAEMSGYGKSTINNFENGRTDASGEFLNKIADVLGITVNTLRSAEDVLRDCDFPPNPSRAQISDKFESMSYSQPAPSLDFLKDEEHTPPQRLLRELEYLRANNPRAFDWLQLRIDICYEAARHQPMPEPPQDK